MLLETSRMRLARLITFLFPKQVTVSHREKLFSALGGFAAVFLTAAASHYFTGTDNLPFLAASLGASAMLLMATPHSNFSQPWPLAGGHLVSALVGVTCARLVPDIYLAAALAVGLSVIFMFYLRCMHPPGGGTALLAVIGGPKIHALGYQFALTPVLLNVIVLLAAALLINYLVPGRRYPVNLSLPEKKDEPGSGPDRSLVKPSFNQGDLIAALREIGEYIDISVGDLSKIYSLATLHSHKRRLGEIRCQDIMTRGVVTVEPEASLESVWNMLRALNIRGVPVIDGSRRVVGMVTVTDFLKLANWRMCNSLAALVNILLRRDAAPTVAKVMTAPVIAVAESTHIMDLFRIFSEKGINHLPVLDAEQKLVGIVTRLDLLAALSGDMVEPEAA